MTTLDRLYQSLSTAAAGRDGPVAVLAARAADLAQPAPPVEADQTNDQVLARFGAEPALTSLVVVVERRPIGLINRRIFMEACTRPFAREVFGRRSCIAWMDKSPLVVDAATSIEEVVRRAVETGRKALDDGLVVTRGGDYAGHASGLALLRAMSAAEAEKTRQLLDSIHYASRIQRAQLRASDEALARAGLDHALLWEPRDVVGGDCYLFRRTGGGLFGAVLDCTGHGVPGAFMTLIALSALDHVLDGAGPLPDPGEVLSALSSAIKRSLGQVAVEAAEEGAPERSDDGLDGACFFLPADQASLAFAGARLPLVVVPPEGGATVVVEAERISAGYLDTPMERRWTTRAVPLAPGSLLAVATDGLTDQPGGPRRLAFGRARLLEALAAEPGEPARAVASRAAAALAGWQGSEVRRDDVLLLALRTRSAP